MTPESAIGDVDLEISVVIGTSVMPIYQLLKMGRGAVIELDAWINDRVWIYVNNRPFGRGEIIVRGNTVAVEVLDVIE